MCAATGVPRPHCERFAGLLEELGRDEFARRWSLAQGQLHENGIAFSSYGDPKGKPRPWELDPLPVLIAADAWHRISGALAQRARLLDQILADLYGPQRLLSEGLLPAGVVFRHPGFLRPCHGQVPTDGRFLHLYSADLARAQDGVWWVLNDRTDAPSGAGYVLENRIVISRMLPDIFHQCQIKRLAPYFIALRKTLSQLAPLNRENPRIVVLSQGPNSPNFFEDAYLARYLGYTLVEGGDLTVRDGRVMLKTLGGLLPIDVILRRPNSESSDPLELAPESTEGVAGLLQATRNGSVRAVNMLGSGLIESPVFMAFLPRLCEELLGETLAIPNVATWWCGSPKALEFVLKNLDGLTVKPAFRRRGGGEAAARRLQSMTRDELVAVLKSAPHDYVAQESFNRSTTPAWSADGLHPVHMALRTYLVASSDGFEVMQGGLARLASSSAPLESSLLAGEFSKDCWVVSDQPVNPVSLLKRQAQTVELQRGGAELPSRVADNLFWLGRYIERAEAGTRLLRTILSRLTGESDSEDMPEFPVLLRALAEQGQIEPGFVVDGIRDQLPAIERALPAMALDEEFSGSLRSTIAALFRTASLVRDRLSIDSWRIVRRVERQCRPLPVYAGADATDLLAILNQLVIDLAAFSGLVGESMTRTLAWRFLDLGRRLEKAQNAIWLVQSALACSDRETSPVLETLLEAADSLMTYRSRYLMNLQFAAVVDLLLTDETNPRSLAYQLVRLADDVDNLPRQRIQPRLSEDQRLAMSLLHDIRMIDVQVLADERGGVQQDTLERLLAGLEERLPKLADAIYHKYLVHAGPVQQMAEILPSL
jgi:uncharacterized circularly permuted ATP-grasp superfamily protein/uncharacterized alpha-E superfamily protein